MTRYTDLYLATLSSDPSFFGSLSVVVHLSNKTRVSCANFTLKSGGANSSSSAPVSVGTSLGFALPSGTGTFNNTLSPTVTATTTSVHTPTAPPAQTSHPANSAQKLVAGAGAVVAAVAAVML